MKIATRKLMLWTMWKLVEGWYAKACEVCDKTSTMRNDLMQHKEDEHESVFLNWEYFPTYFLVNIFFLRRIGMEFSRSVNSVTKHLQWGTIWYGIRRMNMKVFCSLNKEYFLTHFVVDIFFLMCIGRFLGFKSVCTVSD